MARQLFRRTILGVVVAFLLAGSADATAIDWSPARNLNTNAASDGNVSDYSPFLAGDGHGNWVCVWHAAVATAPNRDFDIYVARSADNGETWSAPVRLDPLAMQPPEIGDDFHPHAYTDGVGHWIASWYTYDTHGGTFEGDTDILVSHSSDNGLTWSSSTALNSDATFDLSLYGYASDYEPDLAYSGDGHWIAVWSKILYSSGNEADLYIAHSTDNGVTWSELSLLHPSMATDTRNDSVCRVACDGAGHWIAVWSSYDPNGDALGTDDDLFYSLSSDGYTWSTPAPLNTDAATDFEDDKIPRIALAPGGRWVVTWYRGNLFAPVTDDDIVRAYSDDYGVTWSAPAYVNPTASSDSAHDIMPTIATDGAGHWMTVFYSKNTLGQPVGSDDNVQYAYSLDNGVTWPKYGFVNSYATDPSDFNYDWNPEVFYANHGKWLVVWYSQFKPAGQSGSDWDLMISSACTPLLAGDHNCDGSVDLVDLAAFQRCYGAAGPFTAPCGRFDNDDSGAVDFADFAAMSAAFTGPGS